MAEGLIRSHLVPGEGGEQLRLKPAQQNRQAGVRLDVLAPIAGRSTAFCVVGQAVFIPSGQVAALCEALTRLANAPPLPDPLEDEF
jgi:hypothetical protein